MKTKILMLKKDNEKKEIEFELEYLTSLTTAQRFKMMFETSLYLARMLKRHEHRKSPQITQRT
jgi:hypothetical protein